MSESLKGVEEFFDESTTTDSTATFNALWEILGEVKAKVDARFDTQLDPSSEEFSSYGDPDGPRGSISAYVGPEIDWMIHSWIGNPEAGFTNMHLTAWLGPQTPVPHLGLAWGTIPDLWFYIDFQPRSDLMVNTSELFEYFDPFNERFLELRADPRLTTFTSKSTYVRQAVSEVAPCFTAPTNADSLTLIRELAHERVDAWLSHIDAAPEVPEADRAALAERDLTVRRNIAVLDPANVMGVRFFGQEWTDKLVGQLWGEHRQLPRPGGGGL